MTQQMESITAFDRSQLVRRQGQHLHERDVEQAEVTSPNQLSLPFLDFDVLASSNSDPIKANDQVTVVSNQDFHKQSQSVHPLLHTTPVMKRDCETDTIPPGLPSLETVHKWTCDVCSYSTNSSSSYKDHCRVHTGERPFNCSHCGKGFKTKSDWRRHIRIHSKGRVLYKDMQRSFICNVCGNGYVHSHDLKRHVRTHTGEKPFKCSDCGQAFKRKRNLTEHIRTHTGKRRPFQCWKCKKRFNRNYARNAHVKRCMPWLD